MQRKTNTASETNKDREMIKTTTKKKRWDRNDRQEYGYTGINVYNKYNAYVIDIITTD